ncbi:hypothetical protein GCM10007388_13170 [Pseudoduganella plicata]|uniref:Uncharacterized protein n=1 Tax=Pseudoduganella plicata TaxID=321984 RepID=A0AA87Y545_9BURK|nr:hypothetical protein GCM10007388_13170 [Pseudoduganella plicata]
MCLVGCIANGGEADEADKAANQASKPVVVSPHEDSRSATAAIASPPRSSGYFHAYANRAWNCHGKSRRPIELTVTFPGVH